MDKDKTSVEIIEKIWSRRDGVPTVYVPRLTVTDDSCNEEKAKGEKTLIFNNGISTSQHVYHVFKNAGYNIKHLDNTTSKPERKLR